MIPLKPNYFYVLLLLSLGCNSAGLQTQLLGRWQMTSVTIEGQDRATDLNPENNRWIAFKRDGSFSSGSGEQQENSGHYTLDFQNAKLDLDSDAGPGDDSSWQLKIEENQMSMQGIGTRRQEESIVYFVRVE